MGQVKIGDNPETIHPNALLEMESTTKGLLIPRISNDQRDASFSIDDTPVGMLIFNTSVQRVQILSEFMTPTGKSTKRWENYMIYQSKERSLNPMKGELYYNSETQQLEFFNGEEWRYSFQFVRLEYPQNPAAGDTVYNPLSNDLEILMERGGF